MTCVAFSPAAQLQAVSAERATLGVGGGADAAAAGGGARELPAGPASVQLASPVRANPAPPPPPHALSLSLGKSLLPSALAFPPPRNRS